jgi:predicted phosphodiesterase
MRLAVLSDIHGNLTALESALADLEAQGGADTLWLLGDFAAFGARPAECIQRVQALAEKWGEQHFGAISGNTDRYLVTGDRPRGRAAKDEEAFNKLLAARQQHDANVSWGLSKLSYAEYEFLAKLRPELDLEVAGYGYVIGYHGTPGNDEGLLTPETSEEEAADALMDREGRLGIGGHIHTQMVRQIGGWQVVNVGSVGMSFDMAGYAQYGIFTFADGDVQINLRAVPYDVEAAIAELSAHGYPSLEVASKRLREGMKP